MRAREWGISCLTGREFHLRQDRPHTSTLVAPGQQGQPPWLNVADPQRGANELHLVGTNSFSLSPWVCPTMAKMVPGSKCPPHDLPDYPVGEDSRQMIAERVGGPLINTKVDQRGENAPLREGGNCNWGQEDPSWERPRQEQPVPTGAGVFTLKPIAPSISSVREHQPPTSRKNDRISSQAPDSPYPGNALQPTRGIRPYNNNNNNGSATKLFAYPLIISLL